MVLTYFKRIVKSGFHAFWRNGFVSLASVLVMIIALFVITSTMFMSAIFDATLEGIQEKVDVNVYFVPRATESEVFAVKEAIENLPEVAEVVYVTPEEALINFQNEYRDDQTTLQALDELDENPFGARLNIRAKEPSQYQGVADFLATRTETATGSALIDEVNFQQNKEAIDRLSRIIEGVETFSFILALTLIIIAVLITFNTIRLAIYVSREEISVMRLVGASVSYIRGPFVFTGIMYGVVAGIITLIALYPLTFWLGDVTERFFIGINLFDYFISNFGQIFLVVIGSGILMGAVSSYLAVMRYLQS